MKQRNHVAKTLEDRKYRQRVVLSRKGAGSYNRKRDKRELNNAR